MRLLTACLCVVVFAACGGDGDPPDRSAPVATSTTTTTTTTATVLALRGFSSPSGNVACAIDAGSVRCDIRDRDWEPPPKPSSCDTDWGHALAVEDGRAIFLCAGDTAFGPEDVLPYGATNRVGDFECHSEQAAMTCRDTTTGHGFELARARYRLF